MYYVIPKAFEFSDDYSSPHSVIVSKSRKQFYAYLILLEKCGTWLHIRVL